MLIVIAHPTDESFIFGGMIAKYAASGWNIRLISAVSQTADDVSPDIRQRELEKAGQILGVSEIKSLGFSEGRLSSIAPGTLEDMLEQYMKTMLPDVVVTFGTLGINNDPDHQKVCFATTYAFQKYAKHLWKLSQPEAFTKGRGKEWKQYEYTRAFGATETYGKESKLYYACYPKSIVEYLQKIKNLPLESYGKPWVGTEDKSITTVLDIKNVKTKKRNALLSYESCKEEIDPFVTFEKNPFLLHEYYLLRMQGIYEVFMGKSDPYQDSL